MSTHPSTTQHARILVGFDATESGFDALALGRRLAETTGAELLVAHVYPFNPITAPEMTFNEAVQAQLGRQSQERLREAAPALAGFGPWRPVTTGAVPAARGLHQLSEREDAQLVVVGSTHRHGLGRVTAGTTAEKLLHGSRVPVAVAPAGWRSHGSGAPHTIGAGFDGSDGSVNALRAAAALAHAAGARLRAIAVFETPHPANPMFAVTSHGYGEIVRDLRNALRHRLDEAVAALPRDLEVDATVIDGDPLEALARASFAVDVLVVGSRGYGPARAILLGSLTHELVTRSRCPLVVVPRGAEAALESPHIERRPDRSAASTSG
jgi:nucleotide-binding universal stress UspA family protein